MSAYDFWLGRTFHYLRQSTDQKRYTLYSNDGEYGFGLDLVAVILLLIAIFCTVLNWIESDFSWLVPILSIVASIILFLLNSVLKRKTEFDLNARKIISSYKIFFFMEDDTSEILFDREKFSMDQFDCIYVEPHVINGRGTSYWLKLSLYSEFDSPEKPRQKLLLITLPITNDTFKLANQLASLTGYSVFIPDTSKQYIEEHGRDTVYFS